MLTVCWAAKGGSGTTVTAVALALSQNRPTLLVDLAGDVPLVIGHPDDATGVFDWLATDTPAERLARLEQRVGDQLALVPAGSAPAEPVASRWQVLAQHLRADARHVIVDAGTGEPPPEVVHHADAALLVTRPCYLSVTRACALQARPTGVVLIDEPGRALGPADVESSLGVPVVATLLLDPRIARAVDAGLGTARLPRGCIDQLRGAA